MVDILVRPAELRQISEQLRSSAKKIGAAVQAIDNDINSLKGQIFLGNRADALQAHYTAKRDALLKAKNMVEHFAEDLKNAANIFEQADRSDGRKKIIYLINGINYDGSEGSLRTLEGKLKQQYGDNIEVRVVGAHPYDSNLQQYKTNFEGTKYGGLLSPVDWGTGAFSWLSNKGSEVVLGTANTVYGIGQVAGEYITGGFTESQKVYQWIESDLRNNGLIGNENVDVILVGHSGGGAITANIVDDIEGKLGVNVSSMVTMGSPLSNYDHASKYADIIDIQHQGDGFGRPLYLGSVRSDETRYLASAGLILLPFVSGTGALIGTGGLIGGDRLLQDSSENIQSITSTDAGYNSWGDAHGSYWNSQQVVDAIGSAL